VVTVAGSEVGSVPGRPTVGEDGETRAGGREEICEAGTNQEQFQALFDHSHSIQLCCEYRYAHSYETSKHLQEEKGSGEMRNKSQIKNKIQAVFDYPT